MREEDREELGAFIVPLLKGVIYRDADDKYFSALITASARIEEYLDVLGAQLFLDESEGYAFIRNKERDEDDRMPKLVARRPLTFDVSLLLALLRKRLAEHDTRDGGRLIVTRDDMVQLVSVFMAESPNEAQRVDKVEATINKIVDLGFLHKLRKQDHTYEVRRIIKAFIDAQWLAEFDVQLHKYAVFAGVGDSNAAFDAQPAEVGGDQ